MQLLTTKPPSTGIATNKRITTKSALDLFGLMLLTEAESIGYTFVHANDIQASNATYRWLKVIHPIFDSSYSTIYIVDGESYGVRWFSDTYKQLWRQELESRINHKLVGVKK